MSGHPFDSLPDRGKEPRSKRHLETWIQQAHVTTGIAARRLGWLVASSVVIAALQRVHAEDGQPRVLLKGGAYLELGLGLRTRATRDVDTLFRGDFDDFLDVLDASLAEPWGSIELQRTAVETIDGAIRTVKPRRFSIKLLVSGQVWRSIDVELAPDEGLAGAHVATVPSTPLGHFGLPTPAEFAGIVFDYQVAQKLHACSDPHQPPELVNDRARDVVDLILVRDALYDNNADTAKLRAACVDLFSSRAAEAAVLGRRARQWPPAVIPHEHWHTDFAAASRELNLNTTLEAAVARVNDWIREIDIAQG